MPDDRDHHPAPTGERAHAHTAGPYGFSRPEIIVLSIIALVVIALSVLQWRDRRDAARIPAWTVEDVLIDTLQTKTALTAAEDMDRTTLDVNTASRTELMRLPGIGAILADRIIASRERQGPFSNLVDFQRVNGIGPKTAAALAGWVRFSKPGESE